MATFYEYEFLKDATARTPPSLQDRIIGNLLTYIDVGDTSKYVAKFDLDTMRPVICRK